MNEPPEGPDNLPTVNEDETDDEENCGCGDHHAVATPNTIFECEAFTIYAFDNNLITIAFNTNRSAITIDTESFEMIREGFAEFLKQFPLPKEEASEPEVPMHG
jgi:hypothetical protein